MLLKSPGNGSALHVAYTNTGSGYSAVIFLQCTSENQGENKRKIILQTYITLEKLFFNGRFPCFLFVKFPYQVLSLLTIQVFGQW